MSDAVTIRVEIGINNYGPILTGLAGVNPVAMTGFGYNPLQLGINRRSYLIATPAGCNREKKSPTSVLHRYGSSIYASCLPVPRSDAPKIRR